MTFMRRSRVFVSYRHDEGQAAAGSENDSELHRAWVKDFAHALGYWNIDVIWDDRLRDLFRPHTAADPGKLPFLAEVSILCLQVSQTFMPIVTRGYIERIQGIDRGSGYGTVTEEWSRGLAACQAGHIEMVAIVREWPIPGWASPPTAISSGNAWDYRFVSASRDEVELLGDSLNGLWDVERPQVDIPFTGWISRYLKFCVSVFGLPWPGIERWGCDFNRPLIFVEHSVALAAMSPSAPDAGSQRDLREAGRALGLSSQWPEGIPRPAPESEADEKAAEEKAKLLARNVMTAHLGKHRRPFEFDQPAPGGRASDGLYFGPTLAGFSHLHPLDQR